MSGVSPADFLRINRFATDLAEGVEHPSGARPDRGCLKREARLRALVRSHGLISVRLKEPGTYSIELMRDAAGQSVTLDLRPDSICVRKFGPFVQ